MVFAIMKQQINTLIYTLMPVMFVPLTALVVERIQTAYHAQRILLCHRMFLESVSAEELIILISPLLLFALLALYNIFYIYLYRIHFENKIRFTL